MKKNSFFLLLIFLAKLVQAQQGNCYSDKSEKLQHEEKLTGIMYTVPVSAKGEQFYNTDWDTGSVSLINGKIVNGKLLKYNGYTDELFWLRLPGYQQVIVDKFTVKEFTINHGYIHQKFRLMRIHNWYTIDSTDSYLQVLAEGNLSLYSLRKMKVDNHDNTLYPSFKYLIGKKNEKLTYFTPTRRNLLKLYPDHKSEVRAILRKEGLHVRNEDQLVKAVELINKAGF